MSCITDATGFNTTEQHIMMKQNIIVNTNENKFLQSFLKPPILPVLFSEYCMPVICECMSLAHCYPPIASRGW